MKKKIMILSTVLLISILVAGSTFAWFYAGDNSIKSNKMSIIQVETVREDGSAKVKNIGTGNAFVRVRLVPQWSNPSLSVSNVDLDINIGEDWTGKQGDGYYYYKHTLRPGKETSNVLNKIEYKNLEKEYSGHSFNVEVISEGVQTNKEALKTVWEKDSIPSS